MEMLRRKNGIRAKENRSRNERYMNENEQKSKENHLSEPYIFDQNHIFTIIRKNVKDIFWFFRYF